MPKIIVKIKHLKASKKTGGFINYISKREGVDKSGNEKVLMGKPTKKQLEFIDKMIENSPEIKKAFEYEDYIENPTKQNASAIITTIAESRYIQEQRDISKLYRHPTEC